MECHRGLVHVAQVSLIDSMRIQFYQLYPGDPLAQGAALIFHVENYSVPKMLLFLWPTLKQTYKTPSGGMWNDTKEQAEKST